MQPTTLFRQIKKVESLLTEYGARGLVDGELLERVSKAYGDSNPAVWVQAVGQLFAAAHGMTRFQSETAGDADLSRTLRSLDLSFLMEPDWPVELTRLASRAAAARAGADAHAAPPGVDTDVELTALLDHVHAAQIKWRRVEWAAERFEGLLIPAEVRDESPMDEILTVEIRSEDDGESTLDAVVEMLGAAQELYRVVATIEGQPNPRPLEVVYAATGTSFRVDLKGVGDIVKQVKRLILAVWEKFRERVRAQQRVTFETIDDLLDVIDRIAEMVAKGTLTKQDGEQLRKRAVRAALALFDAGALPREVPNAETVSNAKLVAARPQRLLAGGAPAPVAPPPAGGPGGGPPAAG